MADSTSGPELDPDLSRRYLVRGVLGAGASGTVWRVHDRVLDREVALKTLAAPPHSPLAVRAGREAAALASLRHPGVVAVYDAGVTPRGPWIAMELIEGGPIRGGDRDLVVEAMLRVAEALDAVHARGLLHRDVKPANLLVGRDGRAVLADFGLVLDPTSTRMTSGSGLVGSLAYMAPELVAGGEASPASDWYAWGVTLFELLEGRLPWDPARVMRALEGGPREAPEFARLGPKDPLRALILALLAADPRARPGGIAAIRAALAGTAPAGRAKDPGRTGSPAGPGRPWVRLALGLAAAGLVTLLLARRDPVPAAAPGTEAPGGAQGPGDAVRSALDRALDEVGVGHGGRGRFEAHGEGETLEVHMERALGQLADPRYAPRFGRLLDAAEAAAESLPVAEFDALVTGRLGELLLHLGDDRQAAEFARITRRTLQGERTLGLEALDAESLGARLDEITALSTRAAGRLARLSSRFGPLVLAGLIAATSPEAVKRGLAAEAVTRAASEPDPVRRAWLAITAQQLLPDSRRADEVPCPEQDALPGPAQVLLEEGVGGLEPGLGARLAASQLFLAYRLHMACRSSLDGPELARLDLVLDRIEELLPGHARVMIVPLEATLRVHLQAILFAQVLGEPYRVRMDRATGLRDEARRRLAGRAGDG